MEEMCTIRDTLSDYEGLGATVYGISVDSPFTLEVMAKQEKINFKLLSDFNRDASKAYDVLDENFVPAKLGFQGVSKRSAFVIGEDGVITYSWSSDNPANLPPFDEIKAALDLICCSKCLSVLIYQPMSNDPFNCLRTLEVGGSTKGSYYSLPALAAGGFPDLSRLPVSIRIVLESVLRNVDGRKSN